jgi:hypothetical protein
MMKKLNLLVKLNIELNIFVVSCIIPKTSDYSKAIENYFNKNLKNFCLDDQKKLKIKDELLRSFDKQVKKETTQNNNNITATINIDCDIKEIKNENLVEEIRKDNEIPIDSNGDADLGNKENLQKFEVNIIPSPNLNNSNKINGNITNIIENSRNYLNTLILSKKTQRSETQADLALLNEPNKKMKIDKEIKKYELSFEEAERQIKESKNIVGVKLLCEKDSTCTIFNNMVCKYGISLTSTHIRSCIHVKI